MEDIELIKVIEFLEDLIQIKHFDLKISKGLIENGNVVILFTNRNEPLKLNINKFGDAIRQLPWDTHDLKKHLKKERKEIDEDKESLIQEIENRLELKVED
jgi:hypothetical protein